MVTADQRLVGRCAAEEGHARLGCQRYVYVEPERPFRMQETDCRVDDDVAGEEQLFAAGTDIYPDVAWRVTRGAEGGHARHYLRRGLDQAQPGGGQFQIRLRNTWLLLRRQFVGQIRGAPEGELGLGGDEFGRGKQQRCVLAVADAPQVVEVKVSEQNRVDIARRVARGGEVSNQPAGRFLEFVDAAASVDQHQLVAGIDENGIDLQPHRARWLERGCEQASCVLGLIEPQRFGRERECAVADDGYLDGAKLEAVKAGLRPFACLRRMGEGGDVGGECGGPDGGRAGTQKHPAVEHRHVYSPLRVGFI